MGNSDIKFSDGVRHLYIPLLNSISSFKDKGLRFWLETSENYITLSNASNKFFEIAYYDIKEVLEYLASDINRLSCASLETVNNICESRSNRKFLAWNLINYYYSAFYSAHSILKTLGFGLIQINDRITSRIERRAAAYGQTMPHIENGMYCFDFSKRGTIIFYRVSRYNENHKGLWLRFIDLLNVLSGISVVTGSFDSNCIAAWNSSVNHPLSFFSNMTFDDALNIVDKVDGLKKILNKNGDYNWLSSVRNILNYNHGFGVWFPYNSYSDDYERIISFHELCFANPMDTDFENNNDIDLIVFVKTCQQINAINIDILKDLVDRHPNNKSFLRNGFFAYDRMYRNRARTSNVS